MKQQNRLQLTLSIVKLSPKFKKVGRVMILSMIVSLLLIVFNCLINNYQTLCIISFVLFGFAILSSILHPFFQKEVINNGSLTLSEQGIMINDKMIGLENIKSIQLSITSVKGESIGYFSTETGAENTIEIYDTDSNSYLFNTLFKERSEVFRAELLLKHYSDKGIKVEKVVSI